MIPSYSLAQVFGISISEQRKIYFNHRNTLISLLSNTLIVTNKENPTREYVKSIMDARWSVEVYHREVKQNCGIERCQARTSRAQRNHIFLAISAWFEQHKRRISEKITLYQQNWDVIKNAIAEHIRD
ncbi:transposase [Arsenophonus sp. ENCA]|uniref:transposase n=1 Tax=Arsenophonus sp. ENCA TaxID=1987579 RepID=UPI0025BB8ACA|nr:transposase [Arsenophonus sp. ENCA]